ncbi:MAG: DMT family transporter [Dehalococcoidia bacterium]
MTQSPAAAQDRASETRTRVIGTLFAVGAAMAYGSSQVITRGSVNDEASPLVGTLIALFWGTLGFAVITLRPLLTQRVANFRRGAIFFASGGVFSAFGVILLFEALARGEVVIVSPVAATNPLFTLLFAVLLLRDVERITPRIVLGAVLVVTGVVVLSIF